MEGLLMVQHADIDHTGLTGVGGSLSDHTHAVTGSGATGGGATLNPTSLNANGLFRLGASADSTVNADQNDYNPTGLHTIGILRFTSFSANRTITGLNAGVQGEVLILINNTTFSLLLPNESASSAAANRFRSPNAATHTVRQSGSVLLVYGSGRWNVIAA
jgi:hypothetical protein